MKSALTVLVVAIAAFIAGSAISSRRQQARDAAQLAEQQSAWQEEKAELEAALERARQKRVDSPVIVNQAPAVPATQARLSPEDILARLADLNANGNLSPATLRKVVFYLEELEARGQAALPTIGAFLAQGRDLELDVSTLSRRGRDQVPLEFAVPPTLRLGLFGVVRRIGGVEAEAILAATLAKTSRGVEVASLAGALQEMAPDKFRDLALNTAHALLKNSQTPPSASPLDRGHRDYLYWVLAFLRDGSFTGDAQLQLVRADSQVDRGALKYLQQTLGPQAVPILAQAYQSPAFTNGAAKEPLARSALSFVGADAQANEFYQRTINDPALTRSQRKNLIEDLNQDGFSDLKNLTARDLPLIENRMALIEQLAPASMDDANAAAFKEAYKDLVNMRAKIVGPKQ